MKEIEETLKNVYLSAFDRLINQALTDNLKHIDIPYLETNTLKAPFISLDVLTPEEYSEINLSEYRNIFASNATYEALRYIEDDTNVGINIGIRHAFLENGNLRIYIAKVQRIRMYSKYIEY